MIYIHVLNLGGGGVHSPVDSPGSWLAWMTPPPDEDRSSNVFSRFGFAVTAPLPPAISLQPSHSPPNAIINP